MPKLIQIENGGPTNEQLDEIVDHFISLPVTRDRQPILIFDDAHGKPLTYKRTSKGELLFGSVLVKDRDSLRTLLAESLQGVNTTVGIGLVEGSTARETRGDNKNPRSMQLRRSNRR